MNSHIHRFIDLIKATEARGQRDLQISLKDAKDLHGDITKLLLTLEHLRASVQHQSQDQVIEVQLTGGSFKST